MKKKVKISLIIFSILIVIAGLVFFVLPYLSLSPQPREIPPTSKLPPPSPEAKEIMIEIYDGKIEPASFRVKAGEVINLTIVSMEGEHSLRFEDKELPWLGGEFGEPGETLKITFAAPSKPGEYRFFCQKEGHREKGEEAVMIVE